MGSSACASMKRQSVPKSRRPCLGSAMMVFGTRHSPIAAAAASPAMILLGCHIVWDKPMFLLAALSDLLIRSLLGFLVFGFTRRVDFRFSLDAARDGGVPRIPFTLGTGSWTGSVFLLLVGNSTVLGCSGGQ